MKPIQISASITQRGEKSLDMYLAEVSRIDLLTPEEETVLVVKVKAGDKRALDKLVTANLRFVISVAKRYSSQNQGLSLSDLINEGNLGLITAAQRFDATKGFKFISYAVWWIRQSIMVSLTQKSRIVRVPSQKVNLLAKIRNTILDYEHTNEREP